MLALPLLAWLYPTLFTLRTKPDSRVLQVATDGLPHGLATLANKHRNKDEKMKAEVSNREYPSALSALVTLLKLMEIPATVPDLQHRLGKYDEVTAEDILFLAKEHLGLRARRRKIRLDRLDRYPLPALAEMEGGEFVLVARIEDDKVMLHDPKVGVPASITLEEFQGRFDGTLIFLARTTDHPEHTGIPDFGLRWFISQLLKDRFLASQVFISALIAQIFALVTPLFTMVIIDKVFSSSGISTLEVLIIGLFVIAIFDYLINISRRHILHHLSHKLDVSLVARLYRHLTRLPMSFFSTRQTGDTISRVREVESIRQFITGSALLALVDFPFSIVFLLVMYLFSPMLAGIVIAAIVLSMVIYGLAGPALRNSLQKRFQQSTDSQSFLIETVSNMETVKAMAVEPQMHRRWEDHLVAQSRFSAATEQLSGHVTQLGALINKLTVATCLWVGAMAVLDGTMTAGQLIAFNMLVGRVMAPTQRIAQMLQQMHQVRISVGRVGDIFKIAREPALHSSLSTMPSLKGRITMEHVSLQYAPDRPLALEDLSFEVPAGQVVGVVGRSGSGKSSLMRLVQRLYMPTKGRVYVDGVNLAEVDPSWLRRNIGVVLQESQLLNRSVRDNIAVARPDADMELVEAAARLANADEFIRALPMAYDTAVGEGGALLSAGQRQRIALARALINNPRILILDEATSALDYESEHLIQRNLQEICKGRTVFIVAHRLSTLRFAHRILVIENGRLVEDGRPEELLKKHGRYASLHALHSTTAQEAIA
jgi:subfamily B ATP-binding cassette protein HlyB/CyaB